MSGIGDSIMDGRTLDEAKAAKDKALAQFGHIPNLAGIGITSVGTGYGVKVNLSKAPDSAAMLPTDIGGVPLIITVVGQIKKLVD
jgi:hypothetical protein